MLIVLTSDTCSAAVQPLAAAALLAISLPLKTLLSCLQRRAARGSGVVHVVLLSSDGMQAARRLGHGSPQFVRHDDDDNINNNIILILVTIIIVIIIINNKILK